MARTPAQRGLFGRWLTQVRTARYERQVDALADMKRLAGLHISQAEYSQWESGSRVPREDNPKVARLYEFFGSRPTEGPEDAAPGGDLSELAAAVRELAAEIRLSRAEELLTRQEMMRALGLLAEGRVLRGTQGAAEHDTPVGAR